MLRPLTLAFALTLAACAEPTRDGALGSETELAGAVRVDEEAEPEHNYLAMSVTSQPGEVAPVTPLKELIEAETSAIDIEIYELQDAGIQDALLAAARRGVRVRLLVEPDSVGNPCDAFSSDPDCEVSKAYLDAFRATEHGTIRYFNKRLCDPAINRGVCYQHGKLAIFGTGYAIISTGNYNRSSFCNDAVQRSSEIPRKDEGRLKTCNRDFGAVQRDPRVVGALREIFERDFAVGAPCDLPSASATRPRAHECQNGEREPEVDRVRHAAWLRELLARPIRAGGPTLGQVMTVSPVSSADVVRLVDRAQSTLGIQAQYLKEPELNRAVKARMAAGVRVEAVVASPCAFPLDRSKAAPLKTEHAAFVQALGGRLEGEAAHRELLKKTGDAFAYPGLVQWGREVLAKQVGDLATLEGTDAAGRPSGFRAFLRRVRGKSGYMHAKMILADRSLGWLGSMNGSEASTSSNREFGVFIHGEGGLQTASAILRDDLAAPENLPLHQETALCLARVKL